MRRAESEHESEDETGGRDDGWRGEGEIADAAGMRINAWTYKWFI